MPVTVNQKLNLVFPVDMDAGEVFVHSVPISRQVFDKYWLVISKTMAQIYGENLSVTMGPRIAYLALRDHAQRLGAWDGPDGVERGLIAEIQRLTNVAIATERGWETVPYDEAVRQHLTEDDAAEVLGVLCFFTCASSVHRGADRTAILDLMTTYWHGHFTHLTCTDYARGLTTSTVVASTGEMVKIT